MMGKRSLPLDRVSKEKQTHPLRLLPDSSSVLVRSQEARSVSLSLEPAGDRVGSGRAAPSAAGGAASRPCPRRDTPPEEPATSRPAGSVPWLGARACGTGRPPSPVETGVSEHLWVPLGVGPPKVHKKEQRLGATRGTPAAPPPMLPQPVRPAHWAAAARTPHFPWSREHVAPCRGYGPRSEQIATARVARTSRHCCCFKAAKETFAPTASPCGRV